MNDTDFDRSVLPMIAEIRINGTSYRVFSQVTNSILNLRFEMKQRKYRT